MKRFRTGAMSHGALSTEAHEVVAIAMNELEEKVIAEKAEKIQIDLKLMKMVIQKIVQ